MRILLEEEVNKFQGFNTKCSSHFSLEFAYVSIPGSYGLIFSLSTMKKKRNTHQYLLF